MPKSELFGDASIISKSKKGRNETDSNHFISEEDNLDSLTPLKNISCNEHSTLKEIIDSIKVEKKVEKENYKKVFITNAVGNMILDILISEVEEG